MATGARDGSDVSMAEVCSLAREGRLEAGSRGPGSPPATPVSWASCSVVQDGCGTPAVTVKFWQTEGEAGRAGQAPALRRTPLTAHEGQS